MTTATATRKRKASGITLPTASLKAALADISKAVPSRSPKPILQNVLLADGRLLGSDLEVQVSTPIEWEGEPLLLPHARLTAILKEARSDEVTLTPDGTAVTVSAGRGTWRLPCEDAAEFPTWEPTGLKTVVRIPCDQFARAVRATARSTDDESSRFALGAVLVDVEGDTATFVATDGRRLTAFAARHDQDVDNSATLVPARAMSILGTLAAQSRHAEESVQLESSTSELVATIGDTTVTVRLFEGRFPRWRDVFTEAVTDAEPAVIDRDELMSATRAAAIVTTEQSKGVDFTFGETGLHLHGVSSECGESSVSIDLQKSGPQVTVKLDPRFVCDFLDGLTPEDDPTIEVRATDHVSAVMLSTEDCRGIIMPLAKD
jgi:DNA polymerase-3 subunit beta